MKRFVDSLLVIGAILATLVMGRALWNETSVLRAKLGASRDARARRFVVDSLIRNYHGHEVLGNLRGARTILEFADYECPACGHADSVLRPVVTQQSDVEIVVVQRPLATIHPTASIAAKAAICLKQTERFADFHRALFVAGPPFTLRKLLDVARQTPGVDSSEFIRCVKSNTTAEEVNAEVELGTRLKVNGTPTFISDDGRMLSLTEVVSAALAPRARPDDPTIIAIFDAINLWDTHSTKFASEHGSTREVRELGITLLGQHTAIDKQDRGLIEELGLRPTLPANFSMAREHWEKMAQLKALHGATFDRAFVEHEVAYHQEILDQVRFLESSARDRRIKALMAEVRPKFQSDMLAAQALLQRLPKMAEMR